MSAFNRLSQSNNDAYTSIHVDINIFQAWSTCNASSGFMEIECLDFAAAAILFGSLEWKFTSKSLSIDYGFIQSNNKISYYHNMYIYIIYISGQEGRVFISQNPCSACRQLLHINRLCCRLWHSVLISWSPFLLSLPRILRCMHSSSSQDHNRTIVSLSEIEYVLRMCNVHNRDGNAADDTMTTMTISYTYSYKYIFMNDLYIRQKHTVKTWEILNWTTQMNVHTLNYLYSVAKMSGHIWIFRGNRGNYSHPSTASSSRNGAND